MPNHTYIDGSEHRIADVAVGDKEDGLDEAKEEKLEGVDLANEDSKGDQNCRGTETSFQHSRNQIVNVVRVNMMIILSSSILLAPTGALMVIVCYYWSAGNFFRF